MKMNARTNPTLAPVKSLADLKPAVEAKAKTVAVREAELSTTTREGAQQWLEHNIRKARDGVFMAEEILTASLARELLERNDDNRRVSPSTVSEMVSCMKSGDFDSLNGETFKISVCGLLNDGQHRCHAKLESGVDFKARFIFGLPRESRKTLDQGKGRSTADYLSMDGVEAAGHIAPVALLLYYWRRLGNIAKPTGGSRSASLRPGRSQMAEFAQANLEQIKASLHVVPRDGCAKLGGFPIIAFAHLVFAEKNFAAATDFIDRLVRGYELEERSPILVCRSRLMAGDRLKRHERFELILRAWNAWREKRQVATLSVLNRYPEIQS